VILDHGAAWPEHSAALHTHGQKLALIVDHAKKVTSKCQLHHRLAAVSVAAVARLCIAGQVEEDNVSKSVH